MPHSASSIPATNPATENSGENDDSRCCRACLGRNTIVKAAAAAGPAVVNISVTQGEDASIFIVLGQC